jgi:hypothetical protein
MLPFNKGQKLWLSRGKEALYDVYIVLCHSIPRYAYLNLTKSHCLISFCAQRCAYFCFPKYVSSLGMRWIIYERERDELCKHQCWMLKTSPA